MDRTERLLDLVALLLNAREPISFAELRDLFPDDYGTGSREAAERKLERDKAELVALGVPIEHVPPTLEDERDLGGYRIDRKAFFLPDPKLLAEEAAALYAAGAAALAGHDFPFAQDLEHALRKLSLAGSPDGRPLEAASGAARRLLIVRPGDPERAGKLRVLGDAVARRKRVRITYRAAPSLDGGVPDRTDREVDPYGLAFRTGAWRVVGWCHLRKAQRVFVVDRIEDLNVNEQKPNTPDFEIPGGFDAGAEAGKRPWQWIGTPPLNARLRFAPGSELLAERAFDARAGATADLLVTFVDGLLPAVLSFGDRVWIEAPQRARDQAAAALRTLLQRLQQPVGPQPRPEPVAEPLPKAELVAAQAAVPDARRPAQVRQKLDPLGEKRERLRRLLLVVPAARRRPGIRLDELAKELGLDPAELRADIDLLGLVGRPPYDPDDLIDISVDELGRVSVALDQSFSRPPQLVALEALALAAAAEEVAPADPAVMAALGKLTDKLPASARQLYAALAKRVASSTPAPKGTAAILAQLRKAAEDLCEVALDYDKDGRATVEQRVFRPHAVIDHAGRWYVIGEDAAKGAERTFRVDRIRSVRETEQKFADPGPMDPLRFQREQLFFPTGRELPVRLRFSAAAAPWALSRYGKKAQRLEGGGAEVVIESAGTAYAVSLALSFAGEAEIVSPPEAREALRGEVERTLHRYA